MFSLQFDELAQLRHSRFVQSYHLAALSSLIDRRILAEFAV